MIPIFICSHVLIVLYVLNFLYFDYGDSALKGRIKYYSD